ncbi:lytic murein transglycosylase [Yinghuangia sp. ASG 101]|uniref:C40 family peptidase n=1 Tax=Yinghuangia sp. ASG 101 TaxID=2896848 RepID=UPI001E5DC0A4|nr:lytic murein transglycosylase [Yinghuangia sp. ASG 101]UGQ13504.1 lytic murein transglycosylase [Yinghuangia sp. ASG 101]
MVSLLALAPLVGCGAWKEVIQDRADELARQGAEKLADGLSPVALHETPSELHPLIQRYGTNAPCDLVTPALLAAQLHQESGARVDTPPSHAGAQGIAQFMPATWAVHGIDANGDGERNIYDPEDAIASQAAYDCSVARSVRNVPGDPIDNMLAAYNAGPGAVIAADGVPDIDETRNYVRNIRAKMEAYAQSTVVPVAAGAGRATILGAEIVRQAESQLGLPYVWGGGDQKGKTRGGFDCSGLVLYAVYQAKRAVGVTPNEVMPHYTGLQVKLPDAVEVPRLTDMQPGDAIYIYHSQDTSSVDPHHVVIYTGIQVGNDYQIVEAPRTGLLVRRAELLRQYGGEGMEIRRFGSGSIAA